jgi:ferredoxin
MALTRRSLLGLPPAPPPHIDLAARGCTLCGVCVQACPTGALTLTPDGPSTLTLIHDTTACNDCGRCVSLCPERALTRQHDPQGGTTRQTLASSTVRRCTRCRGVVPGAVFGDLCEVCAFRQANPFGSRTPGPQLRTALYRDIKR